MHRLLEGDVGTGKTVVALLAAIAAIDAGGQAAIMAPTEILAAQHARTVLGLFPSIRPVLLTGAASGRERSALLASLARGDGELAIGTHALFSDDVRFRRLALVVVDEQHRFGVRQRAALAGKGTHPDLLVMTATPIPRTLALTVFGDLDLSLIDQPPPGRRQTRTHLVEVSRRERVYGFLAERIARGEQAFLITPRVEADPGSELVAASARVEELRRHPLLGRHPIGLLHGRLAADEKEAVMTSYRTGRLGLLVATTVVEVGVDVGTATVMVVEHPERFGLSQLHQLRGRVGRGERQAHAILLVDPSLEPEVRARLRAFAHTSDGFAVAELDLAARGPGALLGVEQHGFGGFRVANPLRHRELIEVARRVAEDLLGEDPTLSQNPVLRHAILRRAGGRLPDPGLSGLTG
jgi:ATP-dependent DNA helicase RecG